MSKYHNHNETKVEQEGTQVSKEFQLVDDILIIKESNNIEVSITDQQTALSIQATLQVAVVVILELIFGGTPGATEVQQELLQLTKLKQVNKKKIIIERSNEVTVTSLDEQTEASIQVLFQFLISLLAKVGVGTV